MRQFVSKDMSEGGVVTAQGEDYRHLRKVLRVRAGDMINVRLPNGELIAATVCKTDDSKGVITMQECAAWNGASPSSREGRSRSYRHCEGGAVAPFRHCEGGAAARGNLANQTIGLRDCHALPNGKARNDVCGGAHIILFQFIPRTKTFETILRQAVECAVDVVVPVAGEYSQSGYAAALKDGPTQRMKKIIKEAMEQSGSPRPITVTKAMTLEEALQWLKESGEGESGGESRAFVLTERGGGTIEPLPVSVPARRLIAVGCEGGISAAEERRLNEAGFKSVHFDCNIMKCETAVIYGLGALSVI